MLIAPSGTVPRCYALVPCAGVGQRAGTAGPKQYEPVAGRPMVAHTLAALAAVGRLAATLVVLAPDDTRFDELMPGHEGERAWLARCGGASRAETVANGLAVLRERGAQPHDWVLVHDAARCLVRPEWVDRLIDACLDDEVGGLLALPVADTLKAQGRDTRVAGTVDRAGEPRVAATVDRAGEPRAAATVDRAGEPRAAATVDRAGEPRAAATVDRAGEPRAAATVDRAGEPRVAATVDRTGEPRAAATVDRAGKWAAQTPQMFRLGLLALALAHAGAGVTDESSAVESLGHEPRLVPGEWENFKLTWPGDFALAERLLATRKDA